MFTIYKTDNGRIIRLSATNDPGADEGSIEGVYDSSTHYFKKGVPIEIPPPLADGLVFDYWVERWVSLAGQDTRLITSRRGRLLTESDWTQMPDVVLARKQEWADYRQALRDIPAQPGFPDNIIWPVKPSSSSVVTSTLQPQEL